MVEHAHVKMHL